jgi:hypothetical protein
MGHVITLEFASNGDVTGSGFRLVAEELTAGCGGILHGMVRGSIDSVRSHILHSGTSQITENNVPPSNLLNLANLSCFYRLETYPRHAKWAPPNIRTLQSAPGKSGMLTVWYGPFQDGVIVFAFNRMNFSKRVASPLYASDRHVLPLELKRPKVFFCRLIWVLPPKFNSAGTGWL